MRKIALLLFFVSGFCFSQSELEFKKGARIVEVFKSETYTSPKSILFRFEGDTHLISYFLELKKHLKKGLSKKGIKTGFIYNLNSKKPSKFDLKSIPKNKEKRKNYETLAIVSISFVKKLNSSWKHYTNINYRKTQHFLHVTILNEENRKIFSVKLDVHSYYTIVEESEVTSKVLIQEIKK